jgi:hypothetical protein
MTQHTVHHTIASGQRECSPADRVTKSLLGYGVIAGPLNVTVALAQSLTRDGFDLSRHPWSLLANGSLGWIQISNFVLTGLMVIAFAAGLRRALSRVTPEAGPATVGARWAPWLIAVYGLSLIAAGTFRADPVLGFPTGTPDGPASVSWHGGLHLVAGGIGFTALAVACFLLARRFAVEGRPGWAGFSRVTGAAFLAGFAMMASSGGNRVGTLTFTTAVVLVWAWTTAVALDRYHLVAADR